MGWDGMDMVVYVDVYVVDAGEVVYADVDVVGGLGFEGQGEVEQDRV
jgi:hypothetical protein